jgi:hypothetical protein
VGGAGVRRGPGRFGYEGLNRLRLLDRW